MPATGWLTAGADAALAAAGVADRGPRASGRVRATSGRTNRWVDWRISACAAHRANPGATAGHTSRSWTWPVVRPVI